MCGIVGALLSEGDVLSGIVEGLRVLEYRGYDSSGLALARSEGLALAKRWSRPATSAEPGPESATPAGRPTGRPRT